MSEGAEGRLAKKSVEGETYKVRLRVSKQRTGSIRGCGWKLVLSAECTLFYTNPLNRAFVLFIICNSYHVNIDGKRYNKKV